MVKAWWAKCENCGGGFVIDQLLTDSIADEDMETLVRPFVHGVCGGRGMTAHRLVLAEDVEWPGPFPRGEPWIGVDLDGTLAHYDEWVGADHIGAPIPRMLERVMDWLASGYNIAIVTARVSIPEQREEVLAALIPWMKEHVGQVLPVTHQKDYGMVQMWDDRAVAVIKNEGERWEVSIIRQQGGCGHIFMREDGTEVICIQAPPCPDHGG